jgi:hypothetical protein
MAQTNVASEQNREKKKRKHISPSVVMLSAANSHASLVRHLAASTLADIEGIDPASAGFCRPDCCDPTTGDRPAASLAALTNSFEKLTFHAFVATATPATKWDPRATNVERLEEISKSSALPKHTSKVTAFYTAPEAHAIVPPGSLLTMRYDDRSRNVDVRCWPPGWSVDAVGAFAATGAASGDQASSGIDSNDRHVFVCSHRSRDGRCGYCGPALVDLLRNAISAEGTAATTRGDAPPPRVHVWPCSHVGGHVHAGNVIVYTRSCASCFGCVTAADVPIVAKWLSNDAGASDDDLPQELARLRRGSMRLPAVHASS